MSIRRKDRKAKGTWVFVAESEKPPETEMDSYLQKAAAEEKERQVMDMVSFRNNFESLGKNNPFAALDEFHDYYPGENKVPDGGAWILIKRSPPCQYTVPPLSIWFAEPWPMEKTRYEVPRVKIVTPKGELGLFPREYALVKQPQKYYEFIGDGLEMHFFGNDEGVPKDQLFYLRSRGISKKDALAMMIAEIKCHGVMWIEASEEIQRTFTRDSEMPRKERLATL